MTDKQFSDLLDKLATVQMAFNDGFLDDADIYLLRAMNLLKEIEGKPWPKWLNMSRERTPLPKRVALLFRCLQVSRQCSGDNIRP